MKFTAIVSILIILLAGVIVYMVLTDPHRSAPTAASTSALPANPLDLEGMKPGKAHVNDIEIAYATIGEGEPIVLIMGYGSTMDTWPPALISGLSQSHRVIVLDNRGMGNSTASDKEFTMGLFADDVAGLLDALNIGHADLMGWSMGASVAQEFAIRYPDRTDSLILVSASCGGAQAVQPSDEVVKNLTDTSGSVEERGMRLLRQTFPPGWMEQYPDPRTYYPVPRETSSPANYGRQAGAIASWNGSYEKLPSFRFPVLVIAGSEDVIAPPANADIIAGRVPGSWLIRIDGAGHGVMYQCPARIGDVIDGFLKSA